MDHSVLAVEDDPFMREGLITLLKSSGHGVAAAASLAEATSQLDTATPTHLLLDLNPPDGAGTHLLRRIRAQSLPVPVALVTGASDTALTDEARSLGLTRSSSSRPTGTNYSNGWPIRNRGPVPTTGGSFAVREHSGELAAHASRDFITANVEPILVEWESFARSIWPAVISTDPIELRDSAEAILHAVVADIATSQSLHEQSEKSVGRGIHSSESERPDPASQVHGAGRAGSGLPLPAIVAEYRALRASVLRLWRASDPRPAPDDLDELTRFNEAIDQSLALAVSSYTRGRAFAPEGETYLL